MDSVQLPRYRCHKEVWAFKIGAINPTNNIKSACLLSENKNFAPIFVDESYISKHNPQVGGYYVRYKDGYESWSPAEAFEQGYTLVED